MGDVTVKRFASLVGEVAMQEELLLRREADKGIFFMPELAFAFAVGRAAASRSTTVFGESGWVWQRERKINDAGPVDLVFTRGERGPHLFVEFKMRDTEPRYLADIEKLRGLAKKREHPEDRFLFCALLDVWADKPREDPRLAELSKQQGVQMLQPATVFTTKQDAYKGEIACFVGVWAIA